MKKILSLALVLVMCFAAVAAVSAASWSATSEQTDVTVYLAAKAPKIDGVISADEWGTPVATYAPTEAVGKEDSESIRTELPEKVEYWMSYDADNFYVALRATSEYYKDGGNKVGSYFIPRFPVSTGSNYRGLVCRMTDNSIYMDGKFQAGNTTAAVEYKDGVAVYEMAIPKAVMEGGNATGSTGVNMVEGEVWKDVKFEYCDQVVAHNAASGDANDGKFFTYVLMNVTLGGEKPAETEKADETEAPATFDAFVVAAVVAAVSAAGIVVSKKRR